MQFDKTLQAKNLAEIPICEEAEVSPDEFMSPIHHEGRGKYDLIDVSQKRGKIIPALNIFFQQESYLSNS